MRHILEVPVTHAHDVTTGRLRARGAPKGGLQKGFYLLLDGRWGDAVLAEPRQIPGNARRGKPMRRIRRSGAVGQGGTERKRQQDILPQNPPGA